MYATYLRHLNVDEPTLLVKLTYSLILGLVTLCIFGFTMALALRWDALTTTEGPSLESVLYLLFGMLFFALTCVSANEALRPFSKE